jgi:hypothetical protein
MPALAVAMTKSILDWVLLGATPTRPAACFCGLSLTPPTSVASNEVGAGSGYTRQSASFAAAITTVGNVGSASNLAAVTFGPFSSSAVISGMFLADTVSSGVGTGLLFGNLSTVRSALPGDSLALAIGALSVTIQ